MKKGNIFIVLLLLSQILMIAGSYIDKGYQSVFSIAGFILCIVVDIIFLYVYFIGSKKEKIEKELDEVRFLTEIERKKNDLLCESQKQLQDQKAELESAMKHYCSNVIVNAVVREKDKKCKELGFDLDLDLMIPNKLEIEPLHVCSIFSNLLDNALEAVTNMEPSNRSIQLSAKIQNNYLCVKVSNTASKEHVKRGKRKNRGYGNLILQDIAVKYDGTYTTSYADGIYTAAIVVKAVKEKNEPG